MFKDKWMSLWMFKYTWMSSLWLSKNPWMFVLFTHLIWEQMLYWNLSLMLSHVSDLIPTTASCKSWTDFTGLTLSTEHRKRPYVTGCWRHSLPCHSLFLTSQLNPVDTNKHRRRIRKIKAIPLLISLQPPSSFTSKHFTIHCYQHRKSMEAESVWILNK